MARVTVYNFKKFDIVRGEQILSRHKATHDWIVKEGAEAVSGTAEEVDASLLDDNGLYLPARR